MFKLIKIDIYERTAALDYKSLRWQQLKSRVQASNFRVGSRKY